MYGYSYTYYDRPYPVHTYYLARTESETLAVKRDIRDIEEDLRLR